MAEASAQPTHLPAVADLVLGDMENDLEMFRMAGFAVANPSCAAARAPVTRSSPAARAAASTRSRACLAALIRIVKLSKRFDSDISSLCGAFAIRVEDGLVAEARVAFTTGLPTGDVIVYAAACTAGSKAPYGGRPRKGTWPSNCPTACPRC